MAEEPAPAENSGPRFIDLAEQAVHVSVRDRLLVLEPRDGEPVRVELAEVGAVLAAHYGVTFTRGALAELSKAGAIVVICDHRSMPVSMLLPLDGFHAPARRMTAQAAASQPLKKRLWQMIVRAKVLSQAKLLYRRDLKHLDLVELAHACRSGDPTNVEAQASRIYWPRLFGAQFRRIADGGATAVDENRYLNYAYAVLRAVVCRALCGAGLHPGLGLHHHHRNNPFPLADDLMEPYRPLADEIALQLREQQGSVALMDRGIKEELLSLVRAKVRSGEETRGLCDALGRLAGQLGNIFEAGAGKLDLPVPWPDVTVRALSWRACAETSSAETPAEKTDDVPQLDVKSAPDPGFPRHEEPN